jgi:hypothetical protein
MPGFRSRGNIGQGFLKITVKNLASECISTPGLEVE